MTYQLVLQFDAGSVEEYDAMVALEEALEACLGDRGLVDGHDAGAGQMNIFIHTDEPREAFESVKSLVQSTPGLKGFRAAYSSLGSDNFSVLHPDGFEKFVVT